MFETSSARWLSCLIIFCCVAGCARVGGNWSALKYSEDRFAAADAEGLSVIAVEAAAGSLVIEGAPDAVEVKVAGVARAAEEKVLKDIDIEVAADGTRLKIAARMPAGKPAMLDLHIKVPADVRVEIVDGGAIDITSIADTVIRDGSGAITVRSLSGSFSLEDGSGAIEVSDIGGGVTMRDGAGSIRITRVGGDVTIHDGSGPIDVSEVAGDLIVPAEGSGSMAFREIRGNVAR